MVYVILQGLAPHHDDVDIFVCQTEGSKQWRLYNPRNKFALPAQSSGDLPEGSLGDPILDVTLKVTSHVFTAVCACQSAWPVTNDSLNHFPAHYIKTCLSHYQTDAAVNHCQLGLRRSILVRTVTVTDRVLTSVMQCDRWGMCCTCPKEQCIRQ